MLRLVAALLSVCLLLALQACGTAPPRLSSSELEQRWAFHQQQLATVQSWRLRGRIGFSSEKGSGGGSLYWQQDGERYELKVIAPLGQGTISIKGNEAGVLYETPEGEEFYSGDVEQLIWQRTGWLIPVNRLRHWILGLPVEQQREQYELGPEGRLARLQSDVWDVQYKRYRSSGDYKLPAKIVVQGPDLKIKLAIADWTITDK